MSKSFVLADGDKRTVADMSNGRAQDFYEMTRMVEYATGLESGMGEENGMDEYEVEGDKWVAFFTAYWKRGGNRYLMAWASSAAGMVQVITMQPYCWLSPPDADLRATHDGISFQEHEAIEQKRERGEVIAVRSEKYL